ncbi:hypothetical protein ATCC90586_002792 [Pythium insidiosum]|nr:hypothetical protein ATCC90586_002792 [Pythium insidiosum]
MQLTRQLCYFVYGLALFISSLVTTSMASVLLDTQLVAFNESVPLEWNHAPTRRLSLGEALLEATIGIVVGEAVDALGDWLDKIEAKRKQREAEELQRRVDEAGGLLAYQRMLEAEAERKLQEEQRKQKERQQWRQELDEIREGRESKHTPTAV